MDLKALIEDLNHKVRADSKDAINESMEALNGYSRPLAERAMDHHISLSLKGKGI